MRNRRILLELGMVTSLALSACGGGTGDGSEIAMGGKGGSGGSGGHAGSLVIGDLGGKGGTGGAPSSGAGGALAGSSGNTGTSGTGGGQAGSGNEPEPCTPASPEGIPLSGSCLYADHCTDEYDTTFGAATLQQICEGQAGTWSTAPCVTTSWATKCTQEVFGGVYIQYQGADDFCAAGCEEPL